MGGDYDGDQVTCKGSFMKETNEELRNYMNNKSNFINAGCSNNRVSSKEAVQAIYNMTLILSTDQNKLTDPVF